jgi:hypothetical protein
MKNFSYVLAIVGLLIVFPVVLSAILARIGGQTTVRRVESRANKKAMPNRSK